MIDHVWSVIARFAAIENEAVSMHVVPGIVLPNVPGLVIMPLTPMTLVSMFFRNGDGAPRGSTYFDAVNAKDEVVFKGPRQNFVMTNIFHRVRVGFPALPLPGVAGIYRFRVFLRVEDGPDRQVATVPFVIEVQTIIPAGEIEVTPLEPGPGPTKL